MSPFPGPSARLPIPPLHFRLADLVFGEETNAFLYYVMPHIEGESLRDRLAKEGELTIGGVVRILRDVVYALSEAHEKGVVHRDFKLTRQQLDKAVRDLRDKVRLSPAG